MIIYAEMGHPMCVYCRASPFLGAGVGIDVHRARDTGAGEVGVEIVGGEGFAVGGHFAFCAMGELGVGGVLERVGEEKGGEMEETYCDGVATGAVVAVVVLAGGGARGVSAGVEDHGVAGGYFWGERGWGRAGEEEKDALEKPFDLARAVGWRSRSRSREGERRILRICLRVESGAGVVSPKT